MQRVTMLSLLAGLFLVDNKKEISYGEIANVINDLSNNLNIDVEEPDEDMNNISLLLLFDEDKIMLCYEFDDTIIVDGKSIIVYDYLYILTSTFLRNYFDINDDFNKKNTNSKYKKRRTKVK